MFASAHKGAMHQSAVTQINGNRSLGLTLPLVSAASRGIAVFVSCSKTKRGSSGTLKTNKCLMAEGFMSQSSLHQVHQDLLTLGPNYGRAVIGSPKYLFVWLKATGAGI